MTHADRIVDSGPGAGHDCGRIMFEGRPSDLAASTLTGRHPASDLPLASSPFSWLTAAGAPYSGEMDIALIAGLWLPVSIWDDVVTGMAALGHRGIPVVLPGVDDLSEPATLEHQIDAVLTAVDGADRPVVVGHSAACTLAWIAADRQPDVIAGVMLVGGFPSSDGEAYADFFPITDGVMDFPGWEPFEGPDSRDLDDSARGRIADAAVPVPAGVARGIVGLGDERRYNVPVVIICPEYDVAQAKAWIDGGDVPELAKATQVSYVDIESGHWPMVSCPDELARVIDAAVGTI